MILVTRLWELSLPCAVYTFVCVCPSLAPRLGDACACVVVVRFASGGTLQVDRRLLNYTSTDLYKRSAQHPQEDAGGDDAWEASPTTWFWSLEQTATLCVERGVI